MSNNQYESVWNHPFDNNIWKKILHLGIKLYFNKGEIIPHASHNGLYYIESGEVSLCYISRKGQEIKALYYNQGSIFNEARTFSGNAKKI